MIRLVCNYTYFIQYCMCYVTSLAADFEIAPSFFGELSFVGVRFACFSDRCLPGWLADGWMVGWVGEVESPEPRAPPLTWEGNHLFATKVCNSLPS